MKRLACGAAAAMIAAAPLMADAACFTDTEWKAAHVRIFQTELQVAALECANVQGASYNDQYTEFVHRFQDRLKANAQLLKAHFQRLYGRNYGRELDVFVTKVANNASDRSMRDMKFCANSASLFKDALAIEKPRFEEAALQHVADSSEIGTQCTAEAAASKPKSAKTVKAAKPAAKKQVAAAANAG